MGLLNKKKKLTDAQKKSAELVEKRNRMLDTHKEIGGEYLIMIKNLEIHIDNIIASYFCNKTKRKDIFMEHVLKGQRSVALAKKIEILEIILNDFPNYLQSHSSLLPTIKPLIKFRNELVHSPADLRISLLPNLKEDSIYLRVLKNGQEESIRYKVKKIQKMIGIGVAISIEISRLPELVGK